MQDKIKEILGKHISLGTLGLIPKESLNDAIIEICEEQIYMCVERASDSSFNRVCNTPNIAKPKPNTNG